MADSLEHEVFWAIHSGLPREAPGSDETTLRALSIWPVLPLDATLLDLGCGPGGQTVTLASATQAHITAVDTHAPFLAELMRRAKHAGVADRIDALQASMFDLAFDAAFDGIWCEGAIYIMGFEEGLRRFQRWLKPGGLVAVTEISWLRPSPPERAQRFWQEAYPGMATVEENLARIRQAGYRLLGHFTLPERDWWESYYQPMAERVEQLREQYRGQAEAQRILDMEHAEIDLYRQASAWYGYEFYIMKAEN